MKKALVLLLALAVLGGSVFAQAAAAPVAAVKGSLYGEVVLLNNSNNGQFVPYGSYTDVLNISLSTENNGFMIQDDNALDGSFAMADWNVWHKALGGFLTLKYGKLRDSTFRQTMPIWMTATFGGTDRLTGYGVLATMAPAEGLSLGVNLPYDVTAKNFVDTLMSTDVGVKYAVKDLGTMILLANLNLTAGGANIINAGFSLSAVKDLAAALIFRGEFGASSSSIKLGAGGKFTLSPEMYAAAEFSLANTTVVATSTLAWDVVARFNYAITKELAAYLQAAFNSSSVVNVFANASYALGGGTSAAVRAGYSTATGVGLYYNLKLFYGVSF